MSENEIFQQTPGAEISNLPDGYVVYQSDRERVHYLNPSAAIVYELCGAGKTSSEIAAYLQASFSLSERPDADVTSVINSLLTEGLIRRC